MRDGFGMLASLPQRAPQICQGRELPGIELQHLAPATDGGLHFTTESMRKTEEIHCIGVPGLVAQNFATQIGGLAMISRRQGELRAGPRWHQTRGRAGPPPGSPST